MAPFLYFSIRNLPIIKHKLPTYSPSFLKYSLLLLLLLLLLVLVLVLLVLVVVVVVVKLVLVMMAVVTE
jgi:hypothetical protein